MSHFAHQTRPELYGPYPEVYMATRSDPAIEVKLDSLDAFLVNWSTEFIHGMEHDLRRKYDLDQSIYLSFLATQTMTWDWISYGLQCGLYNLVARELRSILETVVLFIRIETALNGRSLSMKLDLWRSLEDSPQSYGKALFKGSGMANWNQHYTLYRELCKYTHASIQTYRSAIEHTASVGGQGLDLEYSQREFLGIFDLWARVISVITEATEMLYRSLGEVPNCCAINPLDEGLVRRQLGL